MYVCMHLLIFVFSCIPFICTCVILYLCTYLHFMYILYLCTYVLYRHTYPYTYVCTYNMYHMYTVPYTCVHGGVYVLYMSYMLRTYVTLRKDTQGMGPLYGMPRVTQCYVRLQFCDQHLYPPVPPLDHFHLTPSSPAARHIITSQLHSSSIG